MTENPYKLLYRQPIQSSGNPKSGGEWYKVIAYVTNDDYAKEIEPLHRSLVKFAISHETYHLSDLGSLGLEKSWALAVTRKPRFIRDCLTLTTSDGVLYTDADSSFMAVPDWKIFTDADVAWHCFERTVGAPIDFMTGTMFFRNKPDVIAFLSAWADETEKPQYLDLLTPEQESLKRIWTLEGWKDKLRHIDPGPAYCFIYDDFKTHYPNVKPVIVHRQVSRKYRHQKPLKKDS